MKRAVILSGADLYDDPWHSYRDTSARVGTILSDNQFEVEISENIEDRLADLNGVDLLVINTGDPSPDVEKPDANDAMRRGLLDYINRGGPLLVLHFSISSLRCIQEWESIVGGRWIPGVSMHPEFGRAEVAVYPDRHPIVATATDFALYDERYSYIKVLPDVVPLATHEHDGVDHALLWARTFGGARVVYDALGHDTRSFDSASHCEILARCVHWLVGVPI